MINKKAVFFCSASEKIDPKYNQAARQVARVACSLGYTIVNGGTFDGTMNAISKEVAECGGKVIGIIPRFMAGRENHYLSDCIWVETMAERKELMIKNSVAAIALPGGVGTLDEISEAICLRQLKRFSGKIIIYNFEGFYDNLKHLLESYVETKMMEQEIMDMIFFPKTIEELTSLL